MTLPRSICYSLLLMAALLVSACGQKGPLYIQEATQETEQSPAKTESPEAAKAEASTTSAEIGDDSGTVSNTKQKK